MGASPQMVDWDEDGDVDLLVGEYDGHVHYFENIGTVTNPQLTNRGHLMVGSTAIDVSQLAIPVVNDWNEDGRKDLIVGNDNANIKLFINTGTNENPVFSTQSLIECNPAISQIKNAPDIGDLNGDGLKDLVFGWWQGTVIYYPNRGTNANPVFNGAYDLTALGTTIDPGGWTHLELNDWDEDGDLDLVYGEWNGEVYIHLNLSDDLETTLTPYGTPIQIPASGGSFDFNATIANNSDYVVNATVWLAAKMPSGSVTGALDQATLNMPVGGDLSRDRTQVVPDYAPAGNYEYLLRWGVLPDQPWSEASFPFTKLGTSDGSEDLTGWLTSGESFTKASLVPEESVLLGAYPNPFNPATVIKYQVTEDSRVIVKVFDISGRRITTLVDGIRDAGQHEVIFDASGLSSGIYLYTLDAGTYHASGKMVLMK